MKFKVTKKEKELYDNLKQLVDDFESVDGTILTLFALNKNFGGTFYCGEAEKLSTGFYKLLKNGMSKDADRADTRMACAIIEAIAMLAHERSEESTCFAKMLADIYEHASSESEDEEDEDGDELEIVSDEDEDKPEDKEEETLEELSAKLNKMGYYVSKKPQKKTKDNK